MKVSDGGGIDGELIEVVSLDLKEAQDLIYDENIVKTPGLMFSFMWWNDKFKN
jgi:UDP-sugar diphosphatase